MFFDISKAFDRVWHKGLLTKLKAAGISGDVLNWITDYLSNRRQRVILPGTESDWIDISAGVPQGSILGPLLFLVYINDIVADVDSSIRLFADDTSLFLIVDHPVTTANLLNSDILRITQWAEQWLVSFNPIKTESLLISRKLLKPYHPPLVMLNQHILEVEQHKHLGLILSNDGSWHSHINLTVQKAWRRINIMRKLKFCIDRKSLETIYLSFVRPLIEYADVVWDNCTSHDKQELDKIQNEAARITTGATKLVSIHLLCQEIGWESLESRRRHHKLILFYKMVNNLTPPYLSSLIPTTVGNTSTYNLRNARDLSTVASRTALFSNSFLPSVVREWNNLPLETREADSLSSFKRHLRRNNYRPPKYYYIGKRKAQILHVRLRTNCSSLNHHLFQKNIIESPLCSCGSPETTQHYFFECVLYHDSRLELFNSISNYCTTTFELILFGNPLLSDEANKTIFDAVHKFIIDHSKRFP